MKKPGFLIEVSVWSRTPYSIWGRMQRRNAAFEYLSDVMTFRIFVPTKEGCYAALGVAHSANP